MFNQAIVIGGSIAGLLAARVLSDHFEKVMVIERDSLPDDTAYRAGVPQARHLHGLMIRGQRVMESLFPGFNDDLNESGAPEVMWGRDGFFVTTGGWTQRFESNLYSNIVARAELEWLVRRRVVALRNVSFLTERDVVGLLADAGKTRVTGVQIESRADHSQESLYADLVVDASGRGSKAPEWLTALGYDAPEETVINAHCGYATRWYEVPENPSFKDYLIAIQPRAAEKIYRGGGLLRVSGNRWVVTLIGANGDYPPTDEAGFMEYARTLPVPTIYEAIKDAKPISSIYGYRRLENRARHYERLARRPENFIVMGDAACGFNPIYGQGMTVAALEAEMLGKLLHGYTGRDLTGFASAFQKRLSKLLRPAWMLAVTEDLRYPDVEGRADWVVRFSQRYFDMVARAMAHDNRVAKGFFETMNMLKPPMSLIRPELLTRVIWHNLRHRTATPSPKRVTGEWSAVRPSP
jgi:2-polyprenyl-6-methoxyphenol hydroxylase-like FAD-dependent oxidoreductase